MNAFAVSLVLATVLDGLVAGFLLGFAVVVMPGIATLGDRDFLRAFRVIDGVIQRGSPLFGIVWVGSALASVAALALGFGPSETVARALLTSATISYIVGVQLPTGLVNIPLNNGVQALDVDGASDEECRAARLAFEARWNRWNRIRTAVAVVVTSMLAVVLLRY